MDLEVDARLFVLGQHPKDGQGSKLHLDHHVDAPSVWCSAHF